MGKAIEKRVCVHCGCTETPLWRSGPDGSKTLCNADGVRLKKGKLQLYLDAEGKVTANPGPGNKLYNTVAKRKESKRAQVKKPPTVKTASGRVRKSAPRTEMLDIDPIKTSTTGGKRPFTRGASRKNQALLNKVLAESRSLYEAQNNAGGEKKNSAPPVSAISSVMKEVYGCFPSNESQLSFQTDDSYSMAPGGIFDFDNIEPFSGEPALGLENVDNEESVKGWDLHAELDQALSPLAASLTDGNSEPLTVNDAS